MYGRSLIHRSPGPKGLMTQLAVYLCIFINNMHYICITGPKVLCPISISWSRDSDQKSVFIIVKHIICNIIVKFLDNSREKDYS